MTVGPQHFRWLASQLGALRWQVLELWRGIEYELPFEEEVVCSNPDAVKPFAD